MSKLKSSLPPLAATLRQPTIGAHKHAKVLIAERDVLAREVVRLQTMLGPAAALFSAKANDLLTRAWFAADWNGRHDLLKTVRWLIDLEYMAIVNPPQVA